jgi:hypothetical protein
MSGLIMLSVLWMGQQISQTIDDRMLLLSPTSSVQVISTELDESEAYKTYDELEARVLEIEQRFEKLRLDLIELEEKALEVDSFDKRLDMVEKKVFLLRR